MRIYSIILKGILSLLTDVNGRTKNPLRLIFYTLILVGLIICIGNHKFVLSDDMILLLISLFGIFTALIFSVIFIAPDKFAQRVELYKSHQRFEDVKNYLIRYEQFSRKFVHQLSLLMILSIVVLILLTIIYILQGNTISDVILSCSAIFFIVNFICLVLQLICDIYTMLMDDIENSSNNK